MHECSGAAEGRGALRPLSRAKGTIADWNDSRGFGFILPAEGGGRVFCHINAFRNRSLRPAIGQRVTYELGRDERGRPRAENVRDSMAWKAQPEVLPSPPRLRLAITLAALFLLLLVALAAAGRLKVVVLAWCVSASLVTFGAYWLDKAAARSDDWRIREATLQWFGLAGGWPGAWIAQRLFRHKTRKVSFQAMFWFCVFLNLLAIAWIIQSGGDPLVALDHLRF